MKRLLIIRHAKSSWDFSVQNDFDRPLNNRGHKDAPMMAGRLLAKYVQLDAMVTSTAKRAASTARYFYDAYKQHPTLGTFLEWMEMPQLYHAPEAVFYKVITQLSASLESVALFSHNPGITYFINELTNTHIDNMPTCGIFAIEVDCLLWKDFEVAEKKFLFFDYPKNG
jgi:phosphohistidine phosphatase